MAPGCTRETLAQEAGSAETINPKFTIMHNIDDLFLGQCSTTTDYVVSYLIKECLSILF